MSFWSDKTVVVTGGAGFLGHFVVQGLSERGCGKVVVPRMQECNLCEKHEVTRLLESTRPQVVIHLAAVVGGIGANRLHPGRFFYKNALMGINVIECSRLCGVEKLACIGTVCSYPKFTPVPFKEEDLWIGYPEETNAPYGLAKKMLLVQLQAYRQEYGFNGIYLMPVNLYGPGDNFDLETGHVIPALIRKCVDARRSGAPNVVVWGTGQASREFLYVEDAADAIIRAVERYDGPEPINLGSGEEIKVCDLVELIRIEVGFTGEIEWDRSKPDGQPRRCLDTTRARKVLGWQAGTSLREGLQRTIDWYLKKHDSWQRSFQTP